VTTTGNWVSSEDVEAAYRLFLGRKASAQEISIWLGTSSLTALRSAFLSSDEFSAAQQRLAKARGPSPSHLPFELPPLDVEWQTDSRTAARLIEHVRKTWTALGQERPHWSVLSSEQFLPERIAESESKFFASGQKDVAVLTSALKRHAVMGNHSVFEYGCGIGRVTAHLAGAFNSVTACDISSSHLDMARHTTGSRNNVTFKLVNDEKFAMTESFGVWLSHIVLQHNPPPIIAMILKRMFSLLAPDGIAMFQVPTYCLGYRFNIAEYLNGGKSDGAIEVHCLPQSVIFGLAQQAGCIPLEIREDDAMGPASHWLSNTFVFRKPSGY